MKMSSNESLYIFVNHFIFTHTIVLFCSIAIVFLTFVSIHRYI